MGRAVSGRLRKALEPDTVELARGRMGGEARQELPQIPERLPVPRSAAAEIETIRSAHWSPIERCDGPEEEPSTIRSSRTYGVPVSVSAPKKRRIESSSSAMPAVGDDEAELSSASSTR